MGIILFNCRRTQRFVKGKPVERRGRKATGLKALANDSGVAKLTTLTSVEWRMRIALAVGRTGDFAMTDKPEPAIQIRKKLNGTIRFIKGNHDKFMPKLLKQWPECFEWVKDYYESKCEDGSKIIMCHYPLLTWNVQRYGSIMLHGHCHGNLPEMDVRRMDVGVDTNPNYMPYSFEEIIEKMNEKTHWKSVDHHDSKAGVE